MDKRKTKQCIANLKRLDKYSIDGYIAIMSAKAVLYPKFQAKVKEEITSSFRSVRTSDLEKLFNLLGYPVNEEDENDSLSFEDIVSFCQHIVNQFNGYFSVDKAFKDKVEELIALIELPVFSFEVIEFLAVIIRSKTFQSLVAENEFNSKADLFSFMAFLLDLKLKDLKSLFGKQSKLVLSGIVSKHRFGIRGGIGDFEVNESLIESLFESETTLTEIFGGFFKRSKPAKNTLEDFSYVEGLDLLIKGISQVKHKPINVLIHGEPGTGKTEFVKALTKQLNRDLYEVTDTDSDGDEVTGTKRLAAFSLGQMTLGKNSPSLMVFDEVEDVFPRFSGLEALLGIRSSQASGKLFINNILENVQVHSFLLCNSIDQIDPAFLRRFHMIIQMKEPPYEQRKRVNQKPLQNLNVSPDWLNQLSKVEGLPFGITKNAIELVEHMQFTDQKEVEQHLLALINQTLIAQGKKRIQLEDYKKAEYRLDWINTNINLEKVVTGFKKRKEGRMLLYGPPGTGKTEFGSYLALEAGMQLITKKASDLLSPYHGETEKNMRQAFEQARAENAILQIDEIDSFLYSRSVVSQHWAVAQVNEFLEQIWNFKGIFIGTSNLIERMDVAGFRRFDYKVKFSALSFEQSKSMLASYVNQPLGDDIYDDLIFLNPLTPGDFSAVARKLNFMEEEFSLNNFLKALIEEVSFKPEKKANGVGFLADLKTS